MGLLKRSRREINGQVRAKAGRWMAATSGQSPSETIARSATRPSIATVMMPRTYWFPAVGLPNEILAESVAKALERADSVAGDAQSACARSDLLVQGRGAAARGCSRRERPCLGPDRHVILSIRRKTVVLWRHGGVQPAGLPRLERRQGEAHETDDNGRACSAGRGTARLRQRSGRAASRRAPGRAPLVRPTGRRRGACLAGRDASDESRQPRVEGASGDFRLD